MSDPRLLQVRGAADPAAIRSATFEGREHMVVPVIALVGGAVIEPVGSDGPELVPGEVLASAPSGWDGRPVMPDHPDGGRASANEPARLERDRIGTVFNARYEAGRLKLEAWLDVGRAERMGGLALDIIERLRAGGQVEVSVGCYVTTAARGGRTAGGEEYAMVWTQLTPDHLAMLPADAVGACSIEMGCGAPRAAKGVNVDAERKAPGTVGRILAALGFGGDSGEASVAPGVALADLLKRLRSAGTQITEPERALLAAMPEGQIEQLALDFDAGLAAGASGAGGGDNGAGRAASAKDDGGSTMTEKQKTLIGRLLKAKGTPFTEEDNDTLAQFSEARLQSMCECIDAKPDEPAPEKKPDEKPELTEEQFMAQAPEALRRVLERARVAEQIERAQHLAELKAGQTTFTLEELNTKTTEELGKIAAILKSNTVARDYSGQGMPVRPGTDGDPASFDPPDPYKLSGKEAS